MRPGTFSAWPQGAQPKQLRRDREAEQLVDDAVSVWRDSHDAHLALTAGWVDAPVHHLGEARLGDLWQELQADGIAHYARYETSRRAWSLSRALLTQVALEGMHGHLGGPTRQGEIELEEHPDRVTMRFRPCGSGGQIVNGGKHGRTTAPHPFACNEVGVCHYCVHCCVLQQLEPIKRLGYPARVIEPPLTPGQSCSWTVYRDPSLVPDEAYLRVGERPAGPPGETMTLLVVATGGTIASLTDPQTGAVRPAVSVETLVSGVPGLDAFGPIRVDQVEQVSGWNMTPAKMLEVARRIRDGLADAGVVGAVVTHGTDTVEETSFLCDITLGSTKPVVFVAAMRSGDEPGADGPRNLFVRGSARVRFVRSWRWGSPGHKRRDPRRSLGTQAGELRGSTPSRQPAMDRLVWSRRSRSG